MSSPRWGSEHPPPQAAAATGRWDHPGAHPAAQSGLRMLWDCKDKPWQPHSCCHPCFMPRGRHIWEGREIPDNTRVKPFLCDALCLSWGGWDTNVVASVHVGAPRLRKHLSMRDTSAQVMGPKQEHLHPPPPCHWGPLLGVSSSPAARVPTGLKQKDLELVVELISACK